jgi:integrase
MPKPDIDGIFNSLDVGDNTRHEYRQRIIPFMAFVQTEGLSLNVLLDYKRLLASREDYAISTKNKNLVVAKVFLRECHRLGLIERDISSNVRCFRQDKRHKVNGLSDDEVLLIGQWVKDNPSKTRERAMLCLAIMQGLRQFEICNIKLKDIDFKAGTLMVLGKARDDQEAVHLHPKTTRALRIYCRSQKLEKEDYIFTSLRRPSSKGKLTTRGLQVIIKGVFAELEIDRTVHGCRHYYVSRLITTMPGKLMTVAGFTRHKSLEMLQIYDDSYQTSLDLEYYRKAFNDLKL